PEPVRRIRRAELQSLVEFIGVVWRNEVGEDGGEHHDQNDRDTSRAQRFGAHKLPGSYPHVVDNRVVSDYDTIWSRSCNGHLSLPLAIADSGIEPGIKQVDEQVDKHKGEGNEQHQGLYHRDVAMGNGVDHETAETIQGKDGFGHHQPTDEKSNFRANNRDD